MKRNAPQWLQEIYTKTGVTKQHTPEWLIELYTRTGLLGR